MAKKRTNIFEMLLNDLLKDKVIYDDDDNQMTVDNVRFNGKTNTVYAVDTSGNTLTFFIDDNIDIETYATLSESLDKDKIKKLTNKNR